MGDNTVNATIDMGLTPADLLQLTSSYNATMAELRARTLAVGKFSWQVRMGRRKNCGVLQRLGTLCACVRYSAFATCCAPAGNKQHPPHPPPPQMLWTGGVAGGKGSTCPETIVRAPAAECAADLTQLCAPGAPPQTEAMMYAFSPGGCGGDPSHLSNAANDVANFLLIRGNYAWIGHGWKSCSKVYEYPAVLNTDVGTPLGLCTQTAPGVFSRNYTKVSVEMNCNTGESRITPRA